MSNTGLYVYAIIPAEGLSTTQLPQGINDQSLYLVESNGLAAIVHESAPEPYQGPDADVQRWILEHSDVVDAAWQHLGTILPVTFNVIVAPGDDAEHQPVQRLQAWLAKTADTMRAHLDKLRDHVELRVNISLDEDTATANDPELAKLRDGIDTRPAGVQRLYRKRLAERTRKAADRIADELYPRIRKRLIALAEDMVESPRLQREPGSVTVLNASLLVHRDVVDAIGVELADIRDNQPGAQIRYLGPWPPYSFGELPEVDNDPTSA